MWRGNLKNNDCRMIEWDDYRDPFWIIKYIKVGLCGEKRKTMRP